MITTENPIVSVIIVTYNSEDELPACLNSIEQQSIPCEAFIIDNASTDSSAMVIKQFAARFSGIHPILNNNNRGLAAANNQPLGLCRGKYILILNPDTILEQDTLSKLVDYLEKQPGVGVVGPRFYFEDGSPHTSYHYTWSFWNILLWRTVPYVVLRSLYDRFARYPETEVFFVSGACLMIRRELFEKLGGYDKTYFLCVEDAADLCLRAWKEGYSTVFYPEARIVHMTGRSREGINYFARILNYNGCIYYLRKHYGAAPSAGIWMVLLITSLVKVWVNWMLALFFPARRQFATIYALLVRDLLSGRLLRADLSENGVHVISDELTLKTKR